jgi:hypothetical protein
MSKQISREIHLMILLGNDVVEGSGLANELEGAAVERSHYGIAPAHQQQMVTDRLEIF